MRASFNSHALQKKRKQRKKCERNSTCAPAKEHENIVNQINTMSIPRVFINGSCRKINGQHVGSYAQYWGKNNDLNSKGILPCPISNQRAKLWSAIKAIEGAKKNNMSELKIISDSSYLVKSQTELNVFWKDRGYNNRKGHRIMNKDLFIKLNKISENINLTWLHVPGYAGVHGNEKAKQMSTSVLETKATCHSVGHIDAIKSSQHGNSEKNKLKNFIMTRKHLTYGNMKPILSSQVVKKHDEFLNSTSNATLSSQDNIHVDMKNETDELSSLSSESELMQYSRETCHDVFKYNFNIRRHENSH